MNVIEIIMNEKDFEEKLNELYGTIEICGQSFDQGTALKELDPIAFDCALADEPTYYQCGECHAVFDDGNDAEECCQPTEESSIPLSDTERLLAQAQKQHDEEKQ